MEEGKKDYRVDNQIHFTYKPDGDMNSLCQGDVLEITDELKKVLEEVHPYFLNEQYKYFMVLSQSCDLVRRKGKECKTPYITLAAVRDYNSFLAKELINGKYADSVNGFLLVDEKKRERAYQFVERVYNNTESDYFFLYKEDALNFPESMVAYLKVSIALKSKEHYETCLRAKRIELSDEFKAKLGWLIGNMYSRVGTTDWESIMSAQEKKEMLNNELESACVIGGKEQLKQLKQKLEVEAEQIHNHGEAVEYISGIEIPTKYEKAMLIIEDIFKTTNKAIPMEEKEKLLNVIKNRSAIKMLFS